MRNVTLITLLFASLGALTASAQEVLVWQQKGDGYETSWVSVSGDKATVVATRGEAVISDGTRLWAARLETKETRLYSCDDMESTKKKAPEGVFSTPWLTLIELTGTNKQEVIPLLELDFGEVWSHFIKLTGSVGPYLMVNHVNTGYGCGAHGFDDSGMSVYNAGLGKHVKPGVLLKNEAEAAKKPTEALLAKAKKEECYEEEMSENSVFLDGMRMTAKNGAVDVEAVWVHPTGADWMFACTIEHGASMTRDQLSRKVDPSQAEITAMKALGVSGTVGYAPINLTGAARDAALNAFKTKSLPGVKRNRATADAAPFINTGRKLTKAKQYPQAIKAFTTAIRKDPKAARAWSGRGYARLLAGELDKAARDFDHALTLDATDAFHAAIYFNLGQVAEKQNKWRAARRAYRHAIALKPSKAAQKALDAVQKKLSK